MDRAVLGERICFLRLCDGDLYDAERAINAIKALKGDELRPWLVRYVAITYSKPFSKNFGKITKEHRLEKKFVPPESHQLHDAILDYRNKWWAHSDINEKNPILSSLVWHIPELGLVRPMQIKADHGVPLLMERLDDMASLIKEVRENISEELSGLNPHFYNQTT